MESNPLSEEIEALREAVSCFMKLGKGLGAGLDTLLESEAAYFRGDIQQAEILAYKAMYKAESNGQDSVCLGVYGLLSHVAIHKEDIELWKTMQRNLKHFLQDFPKNRVRNRQMLELLQGELSNAMQAPEQVLPWIQAGAGQMMDMPMPMLELATYVYVAFLYNSRRMEKALGAIGASVEENKGGYQGMQSFILLYGASCEAALGNRDRAREYFLQAASGQKTEDFLLGFAEFHWILEGILEECLQESPFLMEQIKKIYQPYGVGWQKIRYELTHQKLPWSLTQREYEVAYLAARGRSNQEIAENLHITINTVRGHMRQIFEKLNINKRTELFHMIIPGNENSQ